MNNTLIFASGPSRPARWTPSHTTTTPHLTKTVLGACLGEKRRFKILTHSKDDDQHGYDDDDDYVSATAHFLLDHIVPDHKLDEDVREKIVQTVAYHSKYRDGILFEVQFVRVNGVEMDYFDPGLVKHEKVTQVIAKEQPNAWRTDAPDQHRCDACMYNVEVFSAVWSIWLNTAVRKRGGQGQQQQQLVGGMTMNPMLTHAEDLKKILLRVCEPYSAYYPKQIAEYVYETCSEFRAEHFSEFAEMATKHKYELEDSHLPDIKEHVCYTMAKQCRKDDRAYKTMTRKTNLSSSNSIRKKKSLNDQCEACKMALEDVHYSFRTKKQLPSSSSSKDLEVFTFLADYGEGICQRMPARHHHVSASDIEVCKDIMEDYSTQLNQAIKQYSTTTSSSWTKQVEIPICVHAIGACKGQQEQEEL